MGHLALCILALATGYTKAASIPECCKEKTVGGVAYRLVDETDTDKYGCKSNCVFEKESSPGSRFCFKEGDLEVVCEGDGASGSHSTTLRKKSLASYPMAVCNDGTPAAYYASDQVEGWAGVVVYLQEGGACLSVEDCNARCQVYSPGFCTEDTAEEHVFDYTMWSEDPEENPPFHNFYKIFVPYCSSDLYSGTRNASEESGNYFFHGKFIVQAVVEDIMRNTPGIAELKQFVLIGGSAGAFGVGYNCDLVAEFIHTDLNSEVDVRCIADGGDFYPTSLRIKGCDPYIIGKFASDFWFSVPDSSCVALSEADSLDCLIFPSYFQHIATPMMVVTNYVDTSMAVHPCTPPVDQDTQFWDTWKEQMMVLANNFTKSKPLNGLFLSNCPFHVSVLREFAWGDMDVQLADGEGSEVLRKVVQNWLTREGPYQALDSPTEQNDKCPY